jgi:DNA processing protein
MLDAGPRQATYIAALLRLPGVGRWSAIQIARAFPEADWLSAPETTRVERLGPRPARALADVAATDWLAHTAAAYEMVGDHEARGIRVVAVDEPDYPPLMRLATNPPPLLYVRGSTEILRTADMVAVVGTREPTPSGEVVAGRLAAAMVEAGFAVASGLAKGIDTAAHVGTLEAGGKTVAFLGTAIDKIYPAANKHLAARIERDGGALVSEYPVGFPTSGRQFVERDRLQAASSIAVMPVQTGREGGTLHTLRFARELHRAVLAPRPLLAEESHPMYDGIKDLIESGRAVIVEGQADYELIAAYLRSHRDWLLDPDGTPRPPPPNGARSPDGADAQQLGLFGSNPSAGHDRST